MNKTGYLKTPIVHEFINYFSDLIEGKSINHQYEIRDTKLPDGYKEDHCEKDGSLKIDNLEDAFKKYWWKSKDYYQNKTKLDQLEKEMGLFQLLKPLIHAQLNLLQRLHIVTQLMSNTMI